MDRGHMGGRNPGPYTRVGDGGVMNANDNNYYPSRNEEVSFGRVGRLDLVQGIHVRSNMRTTNEVS